MYQCPECQQYFDVDESIWKKITPECDKNGISQIVGECECGFKMVIGIELSYEDTGYYTFSNSINSKTPSNFMFTMLVECPEKESTHATLESESFISPCTTVYLKPKEKHTNDND